MNVLIGLSLVLLLSGCVSAPLSPAEHAVRVLKKSDPPVTCTKLAKVYVNGMTHPSIESREEDLQRQAYASGGNTVTMDSGADFQTMTGTVYKCD